MLQRLTFNGRRAWQGVARYVRYIGATVDVGDSGIDLFVEGASFCTMEPGDEVELDRPAEQFEIIPRVAGLAGVIAAGTSRLVPSSVSGEVDIDSGWKQTLRFRQGVLSASFQAAAGQFPAIVLGPVSFEGLGVVAVALRSIVVTNPAASSFTVRSIGSFPARLTVDYPAHNKASSMYMPGGMGGLEARGYDVASASPGAINGATVRAIPMYRSRAVAADFECIRGGSPWMLDRPAAADSFAIIGGTAATELIVNVAFEVNRG